jgi:hypothetical protein
MIKDSACPAYRALVAILEEIDGWLDTNGDRRSPIEIVSKVMDLARDGIERDE